MFFKYLLTYRISLNRVIHTRKMASASFTNIDSLTTKDIECFLQSFDTILTDCDGVLWTGPRPIEGSAEVIEGFRKLGKKVIFVTNNGIKPRKDVLEKCSRLNFGGNIEDIFTSSYLCARYLTINNFNQKAYVFGSKGITEELDNVGIRHIGSGSDYSNQIKCSMEGQGLTVKGLGVPDPEVGAVILSFTLDSPFNFERIIEIVHYLDQKVHNRESSGKTKAQKTTEMPFILSDPDPIIPAMNHETQEYMKVPGTGAFVAAVEAAVQRPPIVVGKPSKFVFEAITQDHPDIVPNRTIMIGDNPKTDILLGKNCHLATLMVGTGIGSLSEIQNYQTSTDVTKQSMVPNYFVSSLKVLHPHITKLIEKNKCMK